MPAAIASRTYIPGGLIHSEEPFVRILPRGLRDRFCESCHKRCYNLRSCKQCLAVKYCGKSCQKKDWSIHRLECKNMKFLTDERDIDVVRLLGRLIMKIKDKEWKSIKTTVLGTEVSFDDIDSHYKEMTETPILNLLYREMKERTKTYIGVENMPSDIDILKITGKVIYNTFLDSEINYPGICFFLGAFMFEHQCVPNSSFIVIQNTLKVWANKKIVKGSEKITVSFRRLFDRNVHMYDELETKTCNCSDCSLPFGESVLSKILDDSRAFSVIQMTKNLLKVGRVLGAFRIESELKEIVDEVLQKHIGVLGRTNILHLKLLGFRCFEIGGSAIEIIGSLRALESIMSSVFGEFNIEMLKIYEYLAMVLAHLGQLLVARVYLLKVKQMTELN